MKMTTIHIVFGPQGAGKSTYSKKLSEEVNGIHLSIDDWMWKLYVDDLPKSMNPKWIFDRVDRCEKLIWELTKKISSSGRDVILDLAFTKYKKRKLFLDLIEEHKMHSQVHYISAPLALRRERVLKRNEDKGESFSFEVTAGMFDYMEKEFHLPTDGELIGAIVLDTSTDNRSGI